MTFEFAVDADALMAEHRLPAAQARGNLPLVLLVGGVVVDGGVDRGAGGPARGGVQVPAAFGAGHPGRLPAEPIGGPLAELVVGDDLQPPGRDHGPRRMVTGFAQHPFRPAGRGLTRSGWNPAPRRL